MGETKTVVGSYIGYGPDRKGNGRIWVGIKTGEERGDAVFLDLWEDAPPELDEIPKGTQVKATYEEEQVETNFVPVRVSGKTFKLLYRK